MPKMKGTDQNKQIEKGMKKTKRGINAAYDELDKSAKKINPEILQDILLSAENKIEKLKNYIIDVANDSKKANKIKRAESQINQLNKVYVAASLKDIKKQNNYESNQNEILDAIDSGKTKNLVSALQQNEVILDNIRKRAEELDKKGLPTSSFNKLIDACEKNKQNIIKKLEKKDNIESKLAIVNLRFKELFPGADVKLLPTNQGGYKIQSNSPSLTTAIEQNYLNNISVTQIYKSLANLGDGQQAKQNYINDINGYKDLAENPKPPSSVASNAPVYSSSSASTSSSMSDSKSSNDTEIELSKEQKIAAVKESIAAMDAQIKAFEASYPQVTQQCSAVIGNIRANLNDPNITPDNISLESMRLSRALNDFIIPNSRVVDVQEFIKQLEKNNPEIAKKYSSQLKEIENEYKNDAKNFRKTDLDFDNLKIDINNQLKASKVASEAVDANKKTVATREKSPEHVALLNEIQIKFAGRKKQESALNGILSVLDSLENDKDKTNAKANTKNKEPIDLDKLKKDVISLCDVIYRYADEPLRKKTLFLLSEKNVERINGIYSRLKAADLPEVLEQLQKLSKDKLGYTPVLNNKRGEQNASSAPKDLKDEKMSKTQMPSEAEIAATANQRSGSVMSKTNPSIKRTLATDVHLDHPKSASSTLSDSSKNPPADDRPMNQKKS